MCRIICVDEEAAYLFILSDNLDQMDVEEPDCPIHRKTLEKMYDLIEKTGFLPVSWFKIAFGFNGFTN